MIRIKSLRLTDFGRHKTVSNEFAGHIVGLTGPNGLGKSTVLQALQLAFTGTIDTSPAEPLSNFIRRSGVANPPKFAEVEVKFDADGREGKIIRRVTRTSATRKLYWDGKEKPITSDKEVSAILTEILGVDKKAINSTVFIRQGEMASMFGQETDRRDFYTRLLMLAHLAKVANVIETHRAHTAGTVQDLGAVRDAAASAYEEAAAYFESTEEALRSSPSQAENLFIARKVLVAFEDRHEAGSSEERAVIAIANASQGAALSEGLVTSDSVDAWLAKLNKDRDDATEELERLTNRHGARLKASADAANASQLLAELKRAAELYADLREVQSQLEAAKVVGEDPQPLIKRAEESMTKFDRHDALAATLPRRRETFDAAEASLSRLAEVASDKQTFYANARESYAGAKSVLDMRKELLVTCQSGGYDRHDGCPLCGSEAEIHEERLLEDIADDEARLAALEEAGKAAAEAWRSAKAEHDEVFSEVQGEKPRLLADETELKRLKVELALTSRQVLEETLVELRAKQARYQAAAFEFHRLETELRKAQTAVDATGRDWPTPEDLAVAERGYRSAQEALAAAPWSEQDDARRREVSDQARKAREMVDDVQRQMAALESAKQRLADAEATLQKAIDEAPEGFFHGLSDRGVGLTEEEAARMVSSLESLQQEHDAARGRLEAANEGLKAASRKVDELDLRTAEQRHRLELVKDLEILRDTFKPSGASLEYLNYKFGQIAVMAADYLAESGADFMVAPSEEIPLAYEFLRTDREDEVWMPQNRLSGGQKVRLAVATLRAIHALVMPDVGLLVLDEPTTHLDDEAKRSMADMLHTIGEEGTLQMIVCDHSPILVDAFSDTIQLPES